ncbi:hypothetical protein CHARACLAT_022909 [Characodon lateralis]|uniref:Uncharacterized protein n=1 Tax=Characodon lateralis TaxID=208331 RepID=A0ABU7EYI8_9TELE|nr:hypothetical protein [Characodon lateralis]
MLQKRKKLRAGGGDGRKERRPKIRQNDPLEILLFSLHSLQPPLLSFLSVCPSSLRLGSLLLPSLVSPPLPPKSNCPSIDLSVYLSVFRWAVQVSDPPLNVVQIYFS